jgi:hypothetical protein
MKIRVALLAITLASTMAVAGSKPTGGSAFVPEIGYIYDTGNSGDLRLANREGTAAILVHRAPVSAGIKHFDLAPRGVNRVAFTEQDANYARVLKLTSWYTDSSGSVKVDAPQQLYFGFGQDRVSSVEFSPDGQKLAFWIFGNGFSRILIHDFHTGSTSTLVEEHGGFGLSWHPSGSFIYYYANNGFGVSSVFRVPVEEGPQARGTPVVSYGEIHDIDTSRPGGTGDANGFLVSYRNPITRLINTAFYVDDGTAASLVRVNTDLSGAALPSLLGHYNCDNTKFIYRISSAMKRDVGYFDIATKQTTGFSTDSKINATDWMPCGILPS